MIFLESHGKDFSMILTCLGIKLKKKNSNKFQFIGMMPSGAIVTSILGHRFTQDVAMVYFDEFEKGSGKAQNFKSSFVLSQISSINKQILIIDDAVKTGVIMKNIALTFKSIDSCTGIKFASIYALHNKNIFQIFLWNIFYLMMFGSLMRHKLSKGQ